MELLEVFLAELHANDIALCRGCAHGRGHNACARNHGSAESLIIGREICSAKEAPRRQNPKGVRRAIRRPSNMGKTKEPLTKWTLQMGLCKCGHAGGPNRPGIEIRTKHHPRIDVGHGACSVIGCDCQQFTWAGWVGKSRAAIARAKGE